VVPRMRHRTVNQGRAADADNPLTQSSASPKEMILLIAVRRVTQSSAILCCLVAMAMPGVQTTLAAR